MPPHVYYWNLFAAEMEDSHMHDNDTWWWQCHNNKMMHYDDEYFEWSIYKIGGEKKKWPLMSLHAKDYGKGKEFGWIAFYLIRWRLYHCSMRSAHTWYADKIYLYIMF